MKNIRKISCSFFYKYCKNCEFYEVKGSYKFYCRIPELETGNKKTTKRRIFIVENGDIKCPIVNESSIIGNQNS